MKLRLKIMLCTTVLLALSYVIGVCLLITASFSASMRSERENAVNAFAVIESTVYLNDAGKSDVTAASGAVYTLGQLDTQRSSLWSGVRLSRLEDMEQLYTGGVIPSPGTTSTEAEDMARGDFGVLKSVTDGQKRYLQLTGVLSLSGTDYLLEISRDVTQVYSMRDSQIRIYRLMLLAVLAVGAAVSYIISALMTKPLQKLSKVTREIAAGDLSSRADIRSGDEIEALAGDFNFM
ncbi:MAG: HAMP domain-containing protein, partial [Oscillospiraceae bacterium]|nr:HAMP domain-containing protein [Oscillospiraceae bacterium]